MPYYAYLAHHPGREPDAPSWTRGEPITFIDFVKHRKDGKARLARLIAKHPDLLPQDGWAGIQHSTLDTEDDALIEAMKNRIRLKLATVSITSHGERRLWADTPGAPAGCYRLDSWEARRILRDECAESGLYRPSR